MNKIVLYIGSKNYSSWSMRAWLCLKYAKIDFSTIIIPLRTQETKAEIAKISPSKKIPCLNYKGLLIWDSLAIAEFINEVAPQMEILPKDREKRAVTRAIACEMHSGFLDLRMELPMDVNLRIRKIINPAAQENIDRILEIWQNIKAKYGDGGDFLLGKFSIADAFFAPVVSRFVSYGVDVGQMQNYIDTIVSMPIYQEWIDDCR